MLFRSVLNGGVYTFGLQFWTITNAGYITSGSGADGVIITNGGIFTNEASGTIVANQTGIYTGGTVDSTVVNAGSISNLSLYQVAVDLYRGGTLTNLSSGRITNTSTRTVRSGGAYQLAVTNAGLIQNLSTTGQAIDVGAGGNVTNQASGTIAGHYAIFANSATVKIGRAHV